MQTDEEIIVHNSITLQLAPLTLACSFGILLTSASAFAAGNAAPFSADSPYMLGDRGGARTPLKNVGVDFQLGYIG